ncbi:polymorphic toxin-type HINT domain-containing protein [Streptomyces sp. NPDC006638]|uniref:polymorphic toxin-type HINT domain-containing protein n=1 Tax=Streptomyces sp. NPDC006638 TaxID=3157183 RepID=UPI0033BD9502
MTAKTRTRNRCRIAVTVAAALVGTLLQGAVTPAAQADDMPKIPASEKPLSGHDVKMSPRNDDGAPTTPKHAPKPTWPKVASATVTLHSATRTAAIRAGSTPISLRAFSTPKAKKKPAPLAGAATVRVLDHKAAQRAGIDGMLFSLSRKASATGDTVGVSVDYSAFAQAYGGAYAARVQLVQLPACAATTPTRKSCTTPSALATRNDQSTRTLTANSVKVPTAGEASLFAVAAGSSSDHGDYKATSLSPSAAWNTDLNTGDFSWSYSMPVPGVPGSFTPTVGLSYSSGSIDGRTATTNNQSSWAGDGFNLWSGSIERSYKSCDDDGVQANADGNKPGDLCWAYDNATLSFNGHSGELIPTGADTFKIKGDDGTKVDRLRKTATDVRANGALNDEYWRVTTTDGSRYYFGYNRLEGWATGNPVTNSTWTVPVFGDDANEPCHAATFADSWCQQAWRWNLDYAVDVHGNSIGYFYTKETNTYARNLKKEDETPYDRGGVLDHIDYGLRSTTNYSAKALARVDFGSAERCVPETGVTCDPSTIDTKSFYWYDTPWDLNCKAGADCTKAISPSFWTRNRLTDVTTQVLKPDSSGYSPIDSWHLDHAWGMADIDYQLELKSIQHTGKSATPNITLPKVTFGYDQRANRLDIPNDDTAPFIKERLAQVSDESGGQLNVVYSTATCDADNLPTPETNTTRCYPVYFTKQGAQNPSLQWFNKYVVESLTQTDRTNSAPDMVTRYSYLDGAAWHYDDDEGLTKEKYKTWSTYRGYAHVRVRTGGQDPVGMKSQTDHYFLRGMDGDKASPSGGTKSVSVSDDNGGTITDHGSAAGFEYKAEAYSAPGGRVLDRTISIPWHHETAKRVRSWGTTTANLTGTENTRNETSLDDGAGDKWRVTSTTNTFENTAGRIRQVDDEGDTKTTADDQCTRTTYADNTTDWILDSVGRVETVAVNCRTTPDRSKDVLSDTRTAYDGLNYGATPTKGDTTRSASLKSHNGTTATYLETGTTYDTYGRPLSATDLTADVTAVEGSAPVRTTRTDGRTTTTAYSPATGFPTKVTTTSPPATPGTSTTAQSSATTYDTLRGLPVTVADTNTKRTDTTYDALGRNLKIWLPNRSKANNDTPNYEFGYTINDKNAVVVATKTLKSDFAQQTSYTIYDGLLRARQTQVPGPDGGRLIADTFYDERGLPAKTFAPYYNTLPPSTGLLELTNALAVESQTWNTYDGMGRITKTQQIAGNGDDGTVLNTTRTEYGGDRTTVTPPQGAATTTTVSDARGNTTDLLLYHATDPTGVADTTHYDYTPAGQLSKLTDPSGTTWSRFYDQRGNLKSEIDPDKGESSTHYDDRDQVTSTTDAHQQTITHLYDGLGRETETHDGDATGPLLTKHVWDPSGAKGQLASATRYIGGAGGSAYTTTYNIYDTLYRPNRTTTTIPSVKGEEGLAGSYQTDIAYNAEGTVRSSGYPAAGSLPTEVLTPTYDATLRPVKLSGTGGTTYVTDTAYSFTGKPLQFTYQSGGKKTQVTNTYQWGTQRLDNTRVDREDVPGTDKSSTFGYDQVGNVTSISDVSRDGTDSQCFQYDYLARLTEAWAQGTSTCNGPSGSVLGGPAPYWQSFTYDSSGNRKTETLHDKSGIESQDTHRTYEYPPATAPQPHGLTQVTTTGPDGIATSDYTYDDMGNTHTRTLNGDQQTLNWDSEGHLANVTQDDGSGGTKTLASYIYDADGNRLIARTPTETTLYLGATELTLTKGATKAKATRYYDLGGGNQAIRTDDNKLTFLIGDHHGTSELAIAATDLAMQQRRSTPFGARRGTQPTAWPGSKGFIGGTQDTTTGLTHLGAREYDPETGRFISVDPILETGKPQTLNGYGYANQNPVTLSDPAGTCVDPGNGHCQPTPGGSHTGKDAPPQPSTPSGGKGGGQGKGSRAGSGKPTAAELTSYLPRESNGWDGGRLTQIWVYYAYNTDGNGYWDAPVGDGDRTAMACWGRTACQKAATIYMNTHDLAKAKKVAATYCLDNPKKCDVGVGAYDSMKAAAETVPILIAGGVGKGIPAGSVLAEKAESAALARIRKNACSFTPSTLVLMENGKTKKIGKVKPGDKVAAADPKNGKRRADKTVTAQLVHHDNDLTDLTVRTPSGHTETLHTTSKHPFWDDTTHAWVPAGSLTAGHALNTARGEHALIVSVSARQGAADMYNLTVEGLHTYYVLAGSAPVLVHNAGECPVDGLPHGALGEAASLQRLQTQGYTNITSEVRFKNSQGDVFRADFVAQDTSGAWVALEVKTGRGATLTGNQELGYAELGHAGAELNTTRVPGLRKGATVTMRVEVDLWSCPKCNP